MLRFLFLLLLIPLGLPAQVTTEQTTTKKALKAYEEAQHYFQQRQYEDALDALKEAVEKDPHFIDAWLRMGDLYFYLGENDDAVEAAQKAFDLDSTYSSKTFYLLGHTYMVMEAYANAIPWFERYLRFPKTGISSRASVEKSLADARFAAEAVKNPVEFKPENLGKAINTADHNYLPAITADESRLFFTTRLNGINEDFFYSENKNGAWQPARSVGPPVNTEQYNEGALSISPDGQHLYYAGDYAGVGNQDFNIYTAQWDGDYWSRPVSISDRINSRYYESQPAISADGNTLYFSAKEPNGYGNRDLYVSYRQPDGTWSSPENLGEKINTPGNEEVPFIHPDGVTLYFGSTGHVGFGGADLYKVQLQPDGSWGEITNLGYPINTAGNEGSLVIAADGKTGYFSSDREGGYGGFDIYAFPIPESIKPNPVTYVKAMVIDKDTREPLKASVSVIGIAEGNVLTTSSTDNKGVFLVTLPVGKDYGLNVSKKGYLFYSEQFSLSRDYNDEVFTLIIALAPIKSGEKFVLNNILFETDKAVLRLGVQAELDKMVDILQQNPSLKVEIGGHTDNVGSAAYNLQLSEERAKAVFAYLTAAGISAERLSYRGYGQTQPVADNGTESGRALNRRTEIKIL